MLQLRNSFYVLVLTLLIYRSQEAFLYIGFSFANLQESGNFPEVIERLHISVIGLAKIFAPSFKKQPDRLSKPAVLDTLAALDGVFGDSSKIKRITLNNAFVMLKDRI